MDVLEWIRSKSYEYTWNFKLGGKVPDIVAFNDREVVAFEFKKRSTEARTAVGQCVSYMQDANRAYIVLPAKEARKVSDSSMSLLQKSGIGLIGFDEGVVQIKEAEFFERKNADAIKRLKERALGGMAFKWGKSFDDAKKRVGDILRDHPEGLSILRVAKLSGMHRHTATKYVYQMIGSGEIYQRQVGSAKLCYLKERLEAGVKAGELMRKMKDEAAASGKSEEGS